MYYMAYQTLNWGHGGVLACPVDGGRGHLAIAYTQA